MVSQVSWRRLFKLCAIWAIVATIYMAASRMHSVPSFKALTGTVSQDLVESEEKEPEILSELPPNWWEGHTVRPWIDDKDMENKVHLEPLKEVITNDHAAVIAKDAHRIATAEDFLPHFQKVIALPGLNKNESRDTCTWNNTVNPNFMFHSESEWIINEPSLEDLQERRKQWQEFIRNGLLSWEKYHQRFWGRGIVVVAGNDSGLSLKRLRVMLRQLRALGSRLPVEVHYWKDEISAESRLNLTQTWPLLFFNDLSNADTNLFHTTNHAPYINYQYKSVALLNSRFNEVILMDADNVPAMDPEALLESDMYKEYGVIFWPDIARTRPQNPAWTIFDTPCRMDEYEMESGQLVVDRRRYWYHMQLAAWLNNEHSWYYKRFLLGDKDIFRFTWHALKTQFGKPPKWLKAVGFTQGEWFCGHTFGQHHPNGSLAFLHGGTLKSIDGAALKWLRNNGGIWTAYMASDHDEDPSYLEDVWIKWDGYDYVPNMSEHKHIGHCTEMQKMKPKPLADILPGINEMFDKAGGYFFADETEQYYATT